MIPSFSYYVVLVHLMTLSCRRPWHILSCKHTTCHTQTIEKKGIILLHCFVSLSISAYSSTAQPLLLYGIISIKHSSSFMTLQTSIDSIRLDSIRFKARPVDCTPMQSIFAASFSFFIGMETIPFPRK